MAIPQIVIIALIALGVSCLTQLINKLMINEKYVDSARAKMKELQEKLKTIKDIKSKEFTQVQDELLDLNFNIMKQQMKPTFVTFIPYILLFWLMSSIFAYAPFSVGLNTTLKINGNGLVAIDCVNLNQTVSSHYEGVLPLTSTECQIIANNATLNVSLANKKEIVEQNVSGLNIQFIPPKNKVIPLPFSLPYIGDGFGWLGTFIIFSLIFSMILGKALKGKYLRKWE